MLRKIKFDDIGTVLKYTVIASIILVGVVLLFQPPSLWLPFYADFPVWFQERPLIVYLPSLIMLLFFGSILAVIVWMFRDRLT